MGHYGTWVLARSTDDLLVCIPEIKAAFGSRWWELADAGDGWQLMRVMPQEHEWPIVTGDVDAIVAATGAPVLAGWVSESACVRLVAATPGAFRWAKHLPDGEDCGYDHWKFTPCGCPRAFR